MIDAASIEREVTTFFLASSDFNGLPLSSFLRRGADKQALFAAVGDLVCAGKISCAFASVSVNPHIKRLPDLPVERQVALLVKEPDGTCLYPSANLVHQYGRVTDFDDRPFSKMLLLGAPQVQPQGFDLGVLERYHSDPRYDFRLTDHAGRIDLTDEASESGTMSKRDDVFLQTFGVGYGEDRVRLAVVYLRYLSGLSPDHQQYWRSFEYRDKFSVHPEYYRSSILGAFPEYGSYAGAILTEMRLINELMLGIFGKRLFVETHDEKRPSSLGPFFRPTLRNYNDFVLGMDKILSENLSREFFRDQVALEEEREREDGKIIVSQKGTLSLFEEWLRATIRWSDEDEAVRVIVKPLRHVRRERQAPAHKVQENCYSVEYDKKQHVIFRDVYVALFNFRATLAEHPHAPTIEVPRYIADGKIAFV